MKNLTEKELLQFNGGTCDREIPQRDCSPDRYICRKTDSGYERCEVWELNDGTITACDTPSNIPCGSSLPITCIGGEGFGGSYGGGTGTGAWLTHEEE